MFGATALTAELPAKYSASLNNHRHTTMTFELLLTLPGALRTLSESTGKTWGRADFFKAVIDHALPLRAATPSDCWPVNESMGKQHHAGLATLGYRRHALLSLYAIKNLAMHGEAVAKDVAFELGDVEFMPWPAIKARRLVLNRERDQLPRPVTAKDWDEYSTVFMGESDVIVLSQWVTVTDETCRVPTETIEELLALTPKPAASAIEAASARKHLMKRNSLDGVIELAIKRANSTSIGEVWVHLREIALDGTPPFTGLVDAEGYTYTDDDDKTDVMTKTKLKMRLVKHRNAAKK